MAVVTPTQIATQILAGSYPSGTLDSTNVFTFQQYERRRRYPSCEVIIKNPEGRETTGDRITNLYSFEIRVYTKNLGKQDDEISTLASIESTILTQIEGLTIQDFRVVFESKQWTREQYQRDGDHPAYMVSILRVNTRRISVSTETGNATLTFDLSESTVPNPPAADHIYADVEDVSINSGYATDDEFVVSTANPRRFTGKFQGTAIIRLKVKSADIGSTGEKLNKLTTLRSNGEKSIITMVYTNKDYDGNTLTETIKFTADDVQRIYSEADYSIYRILANLLEPTT